MKRSELFLEKLPKNKAYSLIIFLISDRKVLAKDLVEELKIDLSGVTKKLKILKEVEYLEDDKNKNEKKRRYFLNIKKIHFEFSKYIFFWFEKKLDRYRRNNIEFIEIFGENIDLNKLKSRLMSKNFQEEISNNSFLRDYFEKFFSYIDFDSNKKTFETLNDFFEGTIDFFENTDLVRESLYFYSKKYNKNYGLETEMHLLNRVFHSNHKDREEIEFLFYLSEYIQKIGRKKYFEYIADILTDKFIESDFFKSEIKNH